MREGVRTAMIVFACLAALLPVTSRLVAQGGGDDPPALADLLLQAESLWLRGERDQALTTLRDVIARAAEDATIAAKAQLRLGQYLLTKGQLELAEQALTAVSGNFSTEIDSVRRSQLYLAELAQRRNDLAGADSILSALLAEVDAGSELAAWCRLKLAESDVFRLQHAEGLSGLDRVLAETKDPYPVVANWARIRLMHCATADWKYDRTIAECDVVVTDHAAGKATDEQLAWALIIKASTLSRQGKAADALEPLQEALSAVNVAYPEVAYEVEMLSGHICSSLNHNEQAARWYQAAADRAAALNRSLQRAESLARRARALIKIDQLTQAEEALLQAGVNAVGSPDVLRKVAFALGELSLKQGDAAAAETHFRDAYTQAVALYGRGVTAAATELAKLAEQRGAFDEAIVWYRMIIRSPSALPPNQRESADKIALLFQQTEQTDNEEKWRQYLIDPSNQADPTEGMVAAVLGTEAPHTQDVVQDVFVRHVILGKFYLRERRWNDATAEFNRAFAVAKDLNQRTEAITGKAYVLAHRADKIRSPSQVVERESLIEEAEPVFRAAAEDWIDIALNSSVGHAHYAIEQAILPFEIMQKFPEELAMAEQIIERLVTADAASGKMIWAEYFRIRALCANRRFAETIEAARLLDRKYESYEAGVFRCIRSYALLIESAAYRELGNTQQARAVLDTVEQWNIGGDVPKAVAGFRRAIDRYEEHHSE